MKKSWQRALSLLLTIMMVMSLLVIPAAAADPVAGEKGYVWDFSNKNTAFHANATGTNKGEGTYGYLTTEAAGDTGLIFDTLTMKGQTGAYNGGFLALYGKGSNTLTIPVSEACNVAFTTTTYGTNATVNKAGATTGAVALKAATVTEFPMSEPGNVVVTSTNTTYITKIELKEYKAESLDLDVSNVSVQVDHATAATAVVNADTNCPGAISATPADTTLVDTSVDGSVITITAKKAGTTNISVTVAGTELNETINVTVYAADYVRTVWDWSSDPDLLKFDGIEKKKADLCAIGTLKVDATSGKLAPNGGGWGQINAGTKIQFPVNGQTGQKAKVKVKMYAAGNTVKLGDTTTNAAEQTVENVPVEDGGYVTLTSEGGGYIGRFEVLAITGEPTQGGGGTTPTVKTVAAGNYTFANSSTDMRAAVDGITLDEAFAADTSSHGPVSSVNKPVTITLNLEKKATVTVTLCCYGSGKNTIAKIGETPSTKTDSSEVCTPEDGSFPGAVHTFTDVPAGETVITLTPNPNAVGTGSTDTSGDKLIGNPQYVVNYGIYLHAIKVEYPTEGGGTTGGGNTGNTDTTVEAKEYDFMATTYADASDKTKVTVPGITFTDLARQDASPSHGLLTTANSEMVVNMLRKGTVTFTGCGYMTALDVVSAQNDQNADFIANKSVSLTTIDSQADRPVVTVANVEGKVTFKFSAGSYIHGISVVYGKEETSGPKKIDVWDIAGKAESNTTLYNNNITPASWSDKGVTSGAMPGSNTSIKFGELTLNSEKAADTLVSNVTSSDWGTTLTAGSNSWAHDFGDGYTSAGGFVGSGTGTEKRRYITVDNVGVNDTLVAYVGNAGNAGNILVDGQGTAAGFSAKAAVDKNDFAKVKVVATKAGTYKIWDSNVIKPVFCRVMLIPPVTVTGSLNMGSCTATGFELKFVNTETGAETFATLNGNNFTVDLAPDYTYRAVMMGAKGWGLTVASREVKPVLADLQTGKSGVSLVVEAKENYTYSGTITGFAADYDLSKLKVVMQPDAESLTNGSDPVELTLDTAASPITFTSDTMEPQVKYTVTLQGVNDYKVTAPTAAVTSEGENLTAQTITVGTKATYTASGSFVVLDVDDQFAPLYPDSTYAKIPANTVTAVTLKNVEDNYEYPATLNADKTGYSVDLRAGSYAVVATATGYSTVGHVVVGDKAVTKDVLFKSTATPGSVAYAETITVDPKGSGETNFKTITGALAYIKRMSRTDDQRVTVKIAPGTYREQISIDSKNVTFENANPAKQVLITWYYGIGYKYYSASGKSNLDSWYDAEKAFDKYAKPDIDVARWGATVRVQAPGFRAQDIDFESSFNRYLTDEEVVDGVETLTSTAAKLAVREQGLDVNRRQSGGKTVVERAAAIWVDTNSGRGDMTEFYNCSFRSSQDTFGTGKRMYLKNCYIEGMTDYICGPGDCVFDSCTLNWKGYSDQLSGGYITAPQTLADEKGYLFRNCAVTGDTKFELKGGSWARMWGGGNTKVKFLNTVLGSADLINNECAWDSMGNNVMPWAESVKNNLKEYNTILADGSAVDISGRKGTDGGEGKKVTACPNTVMTKTEADAIDVESYFGGWTPAYYVKETTSTVALAATPIVTDNGDINLPKPGHTLTVSYTLTPADAAANDNSTIQWYTVKDSTETLVKTVVGAADKTYQIQAADIGANIKVVVTPKTIGGLTGEAQSFTVVEYVREGFDDPTGSTDPVLGKGVNVFLAGDSTVKDYSADGMETKGVNQTEGSWGEWLQRFFNDKVTVVNYAQGGRTTRQFITDGRLDRIDAAMKEGDFLFIQFGHNDCYTGDNRYVPLGIAKDAPQKSYAEGGAYPDSITLTSDLKVGSATLLEAGTHTTYTGYLKQYIAVTEAHGATAVLMTPVARMYYTNGKIRTHHDATAVDGTTDNEYCKAVKWVYDWAVDQGYKVEFVDNYTLTADLFEKAYADGKNDTYGKQLMGINEGTHNSKLGGVIWAGVVAQAIQNSDMTIAKAVQFPSACVGRTPENEVAFTIGSDGTFTAFDNLTSFANHATYWEGYGKTLFDAIAAKAAQLNPTEPDPDDPTADVDKTALNAAIEAAEALGTITVATAADQVAEGAKWMTSDEKAAFDSALRAAKALGASATQEQVDAAKAALTAATAAAKTGTKCELTLGKNSVTVSVGNTTTVTATVVGYVGKTLDVWSDNDSVATAAVKDSKITIKGVAEGKAYVYAVMEDTNASLVLSTGNTAGGSTVPAKHIIEVTVTAKSSGGASRPTDRNETTTPSTGTETGTGAETTTPAAPAGADTIEAVKTETAVKADGTKVTTTEMSDGSEVVKEVTLDGDVAVEVTTEDGEKIIDIEVPADIPASETKFVDVAEDHWAAKAIDRMASLGLVKGTGNDNYSPDGEVTRATLATMLFRFANGAEGKENKFADVQGHWAADAIAWAAEAGVVNGISADAFAPDAEITREQMAVMLLRFAKLIGMDTTVDASAAMGGYVDNGQVGSWAADGMAWCVKNGIINGTTTTTLSPVDGATRAQTAVMLDRFIGLLSK